MSEITQQAILTLTKTVQEAAAHAVNEATYARFYQGHVLRPAGEGKYWVSMLNKEYVIRTYGDSVITPGDLVYIVSPQNSNDVNDMFILGASNTKNRDAATAADHQTLMNLVEAIDHKVDEERVVQATGNSTTQIMSQNAVTNALEELRRQSVSGIIVDGTKLIPNKDNDITIPVSGNSVLGLVRGSKAENHIVVDSDGRMSVESLDVMRLVQHDEDMIILGGMSLDEAFGSD